MVSNWFSGDIQAGVTVVEYIDDCKYIKQTSYNMFHKTSELALKRYLESLS